MKKYTFNARYRGTVNRVMEQLGLEYAGSPARIENGTLLFRDPQTGCLYGFYESGYCRRLIPSFVWGSSETIGGKNYAGYQLNKTEKQLVQYQHNGRVYECLQKVRILANPMEQLGIVTAAIANYRNK
jgi:hypothetical protein